MTTSSMMAAMFKLQNEMNTTVDPNWKTAGNKWFDAIMVEAVEAFDHTAWKWWKSVDVQSDWEQARMELVDIWHFILSKMIEEGWMDSMDTICHNIDTFPLKVTKEVELRTLNKESFQEVIREMVMESVIDRKSSLSRIMSSFLAACFFSGTSFEDVYSLYLAKNTLNKFRQDHGYKKGTYVKIWNGKEDNEVLTGLLKSMAPEDINFDTLYAGLKTEYFKLSGSVSEVAVAL